MEIKVSMTAGNKCYRALGHIVNKRQRTHSLGLGLYKIIITPNVVHGDE
jgi:hypothetical protein